LRLEDVELGFARQAWLSLGVDPDGPIIGINTGAGSRFAGKALSVTRTVELIEAMHAHFQDETIVLLGGPEEEKKNKEIAARTGDKIVDAGCGYALRIFAAMLTSLRVLITGDTLALHLATALRIPAIALFGPTAAQEIDLFDRGDIIISPFDCVPCYLADCDLRPHCVDSIPLEQIIKSVGMFF
jgi:ADP-heptose:LPS heptosyltransferase